MEMTMRWYGTGHDTVTLEQIKQSCYVKESSQLFMTNCLEKYGHWKKFWQ